MADRHFNTLFLCNSNAARSILAEAILNHVCNRHGRFRGFSAGPHPAAEPNPLALELLRARKVPTTNLHCKSWDEFIQPAAPDLDFVISISDQAAGEQAPDCPHLPMTMHWNVPDPAALQDGDIRRKVFGDTFIILRRRIDLLTELPIAVLNQLTVSAPMEEDGE